MPRDGRRVTGLEQWRLTHGCCRDCGRKRGRSKTFCDACYASKLAYWRAKRRITAVRGSKILNEPMRRRRERMWRYRSARSRELLRAELIGLLKTLRDLDGSHFGLTLSELAQRRGLSISQIRRDLATLENAGVPLFEDQQRWLVLDWRKEAA